MSFASKCRSAAACLQRGSHAPTSSEIIVRWGSPCPNRLQQHKSTALPQNSGVRSRDGCNARRKRCPRSCAAPGHLIQGSPRVLAAVHWSRSFRQVATCNPAHGTLQRANPAHGRASSGDLYDQYNGTLQSLLTWAFGSLTKLD